MTENTNLKRYFIVKEHPVRIMSKCRSHSKGTLRSFLIGFCALYAVMNWVPYLLSFFVTVTNVDILSAYSEIDPSMLARMPKIPLITFVYMVLFNGTFKFCECLYTLTYIRSRQSDPRAFSEGLSYYLKTLALFVIQTVIVSFWMMFLIIPGIIAAFNFSQAFYILADDPDKPVTQVLAESKIMMNGNKMGYLRLLIYYSPYFFAAYIPAFLISGFLTGISETSITYILLNMALDIPLFIAYGYIAMGRTVFYELMINRGFAEFKYAGQEAFREHERGYQD